eukprot:jgi/Chrzof1/7311/Cz02g18220.t1
MTLTGTKTANLKGIVDDTSIDNVNLLTHNRTYSALGSTSCIAVSPAVLHFGGFQLGKVHQQILHLTNISSQPTRAHIIPPASVFFKVIRKNVVGSIAPGLQEQLLVEFCPQEWRYYYDCIKINAEDGNLLVPIHGYPVMNTVHFPRRVDFGNASIGEILTQTVTMTCKVPIDFEFTITTEKPNKAFVIQPTAGIVPSNGHVDVTITFTPTSFTTEVLEIQVLVAEFGAEPVSCTITGSAASGVARDRLLASVLGSGTYTVNDLMGTSRLTSTKRSTLAVKAGTPQGDANSHTSHRNGFTNALLTAQNSALNKSTKGTIASRKLQLAEQEAQIAAALAQSGITGVDPLDQPCLQRALKCALFDKLVKEREEASKVSTFVGGGQCVVGEDVMTSAQLAAAQAAREAAQHTCQQEEEKAATHRLSAELQEGGAQHTLSDSSATTSGQQQHHTYAGLDGFQPNWILLDSNDWRKRVQVMQRFVNAVRVVIYRLRAQHRILRLKAIAARLGGDRESMAGAAVQEVVLESTVSNRPGVAPVQLMLPDAVRIVQLPLYRAANFAAHDSVQAAEYGDFFELQPQQLKATFEYKLLDYAPEEFPGLTPYCPTAEHQPLMTGASEEEPADTPCGLLPAQLYQLQTMPDAVRQMPFVHLEIGSRYSDNQVYAASQPSWGMDPNYLIQPRLYPYHDTSLHERSESSSVRILHSTPLLADVWQPFRDHWQAEPVQAPALMAGPDVCDKMDDGADDHTKPAIPVLQSMDAVIAPFLPSSKAASSSPSDNLHASQQPEGSATLLPRQQYQQHVDASKQATRTTAIEAYSSRVASYNSMLSKPHRLTIK